MFAAAAARACAAGAKNGTRRAIRGQETVNNWPCPSVQHEERAEKPQQRDVDDVSSQRAFLSSTRCDAAVLDESYAMHATARLSMIPSCARLVLGDARCPMETLQSRISPFTYVRQDAGGRRRNRACTVTMRVHKKGLLKGQHEPDGRIHSHIREVNNERHTHFRRRSLIFCASLSCWSR